MNVKCSCGVQRVRKGLRRTLVFVFRMHIHNKWHLFYCLFPLDCFFFCCCCSSIWISRRSIVSVRRSHDTWWCQSGRCPVSRSRASSVSRASGGMKGWWSQHDRYTMHRSGDQVWASSSWITCFNLSSSLKDSNRTRDESPKGTQKNQLKVGFICINSHSAPHQLLHITHDEEIHPRMRIHDPPQTANYGQTCQLTTQVEPNIFHYAQFLIEDT